MIIVTLCILLLDMVISQQSGKDELRFMNDPTNGELVYLTFGPEWDSSRITEIEVLIPEKIVDGQIKEGQWGQLRKFNFDSTQPNTLYMIWRRTDGICVTYKFRLKYRNTADTSVYTLEPPKGALVQTTLALTAQQPDISRGSYDVIMNFRWDTNVKYWTPKAQVRQQQGSTKFTLDLKSCDVLFRSQSTMPPYPTITQITEKDFRVRFDHRYLEHKCEFDVKINVTMEQSPILNSVNREACVRQIEVFRKPERLSCSGLQAIGIQCPPPPTPSSCDSLDCYPSYVDSSTYDRSGSGLDPTPSEVFRINWTFPLVDQNNRRIRKYKIRYAKAEVAGIKLLREEEARVLDYVGSRNSLDIPVPRGFAHNYTIQVCAERGYCSSATPVLWESLPVYWKQFRSKYRRDNVFDPGYGLPSTHPNSTSRSVSNFLPLLVSLMIWYFLVNSRNRF